MSVGAAVRLALSLASVPVLIRFLGPETYGAWVLLGSIVAMAVLLDFGVSTALTNRVSAALAREASHEVASHVGTSLVVMTVLGAFGSTLIFVAAPAIGRVLFSDQIIQGKAVPALWILAWTLLPRFWQQWAVAFEAAANRYDIQASTETLGGILLSAGTMLLAWLHADLTAFSWWFLVGTSLVVVRHFIALSTLLRPYFPFLRLSRAGAADLLRFGIVQWFSVVGSILFGQADRLIVGLLLGPAAAGLYAAAASIAVKINDLSAIPLQVLPAAISAFSATGEDHRIRDIFTRATVVNALVVQFLASAVLFWSYLIAGILVDSEYQAQVAGMLQVMAVAYGLYSLNAPGFFTAIGIGRQVANARWALLSGALTCAALFALIPVWGLAGAAWANAAYALTIAINFEVIGPIQGKLGEYVSNLLKSPLLLIAWWMLCILLWGGQYPLWAQMAIFAILECAAVVFILGPGTARDIVGATVSQARRLSSSHE